MSTNIEIKARLVNFDQVKALAEQLSGAPGQLLEQEDTFFHTPQGRLKLRVLAPNRGELIYYERPDMAGPKQSDYQIYRTADPAGLAAVLAGLGTRGVVRKKRWLYLVGQTRIHLDRVEGLGDFLELEVVLEPNDTPAQGQAIAAELMKKLGVAESDLLEAAYIDLLETQVTGKI
jgi:predicted adenylyl cyclase CyaB